MYATYLWAEDGSTARSVSKKFESEKRASEWGGKGRREGGGKLSKALYGATFHILILLTVETCVSVHFKALGPYGLSDEIKYNIKKYLDMSVSAVQSCYLVKVFFSRKSATFIWTGKSMQQQLTSFSFWRRGKNRTFNLHSRAIRLSWAMAINLKAWRTLATQCSEDNQSQRSRAYGCTHLLHTRLSVMGLAIFFLKDEDSNCCFCWAGSYKRFFPRLTDLLTSRTKRRDHESRFLRDSNRA